MATIRTSMVDFDSRPVAIGVLSIALALGLVACGTTAKKTVRGRLFGAAGSIECPEHRVEQSASCSKLRSARTGAYRSLGEHCAVRSNGAIDCWSPELRVAPRGEFRAVADDRRSACAAGVNGGIVCWGYAYHGAVWIGANVRFRSVAVGALASCGVADSGAVHCWRPDDPTAISLVTTEARLVRAGGFVCALKLDGTLVCPDTLPWPAAPAGAFKRLAVGQTHACAQRVSDEVVCWGLSKWGATKAPRFAKAPKRLVAGLEFSCALTYEGGLKCWGDAPPVPKNLRLVDIGTSSLSHVCGIADTGDVWCWGLLGRAPTTRPHP